MERYMQYLRELREDNDQTQSDIAEVLGIAQSVYSRYERGTNELPIRHLITLCDHFDVSADLVLSGGPKYKRKSG